MSALSPIWPAYLHHFRLDTPDPDRLVSFYEDAVGMERRQIGDGLWWMEGPARRMMESGSDLVQSAPPPTAERAGAAEAVGGGINPSPRGLGLGFDLD